MPMTVGADGTITVPVDADADPAAKEIEDAFSAAIARAMNDPRVRAAVTGMVKHVLAEITKIPKSTGKAWDASIKQAQSAAKAMASAFKAMGKAATDATKIPSGTNASYNTLTQQIAGMANNMEQLAHATKIQRDLLIDLARSARSATRSQDQQNRDALLAADRATRERIGLQQAESAALRASSTQRVAILNAFSKHALQIERSLTRVFELTWKSAERAVRAFARGASAALRGIATVASSVFSAITRAVSGFVRGAARAFSTLGRGVGTALGGVSRAIQSALRRDENAYRTSFRNRERTQQASLGRQAAAQQRFQTQQRSGLLGGLGGGGLLAGAAGGAGILSLLTSGFERAGQQELLQLTFSTLLQDGPRATAILQEISDFARTTSFDFVEVASSVAQFTATLGDVGEAFDITKFLADVVSLTGGTTEALGRVRLAMTQIASAGRLDAANLKQLTESLPGVPFAQILADRFFGGDVEAYSAARDAGELGATISAEAFFDAFQQGVTERFPEVTGFAQVAATTLTGLAQNLKENFSIFGATIIKLVEGPLKRFIGGVTNALAVAGAFVSGTMFSGDRGTNPFAALAASDPNAEVNIADLPQAAQDVLRAQFGFTDESFVSATDAADIWEKFTPPVEVNERLKELRDTLGDIAKTVGGVLAVASGFKILKLALIALTSPLALVVLGSAAVGLLWSRMLGSSLKLRGAFAGLKAAFAGLREAVGGVLEVVGGIASSALFGNKDFFKGLGNSVARFVNYIRRGLVILTRWLKMFEFFLRIGQGGRFLVANLQKLGTAIGDFGENIATSLFGINPFAAFAAESQGGNDVLNLLERTFLGPIVRFFRGPFLDGIKGIGDVVGDVVGIIFDAIFGGDAESGPGVAFRAEEGGSGSIGTKILNRLEDTFLGPIVRFFRGPFANIIETIGGGVADFGGFLGDIFNAIFGDDPGGVGTRVLDVLEDTFLGPVVRFFRGPFADGVESVAGFVVDAFRSIVDAFQTVGTLIEPFTDAIGNAFRSLFGGGGADGKGVFPTGGGTGFASIWAGLKESLGNITEKVSELLSPVLTAVSNWFATNFSTEKMVDYAQGFFGFVREVGRIIGGFVTSKYAFAAVIAIAAFAAALVGSFVEGFAEAALVNAKEIGSIIIGLIGDALSGIGVPSIPGLDIFSNSVVSAIVGALVIAIAASAIAPTLISGISAVMARKPGKTGFVSGATAFAGGILGSIGGALKTAFSTQGSGLFGIIARALTPVKNDAGITNAADVTTGSFVSRMGAALTKAKQTLATIGKNAAAAIAGGAAGFAIGFTVAKGGGSLLEQILGVGGAALGIAALNVPAGIAAGALGILGVVMGNTARETAEMNARIRELAGDLRNLAEEDIPGALADRLRGFVLELPADQLSAFGTAFADADFDFDFLAQQIIDGSANIDNAMQNFLLGLTDDAAAIGVSSEDWRHAIEQYASSGKDLDEFLVSGLPGADVLRGALEDLGITLSDTQGIQDTLSTSITAGGGALEFLAGQAVVAGTAVSKALNTTGGLQLARSIGNVQVPLEDFETAAADAQAALEQLLNVNSYGGSFQALHDELQLTFSGLPEAITSGLEGVASEDVQATIRQIVGPIGDDFGGLLAQAVDEGLVTNVPQLDAFQAELVRQIKALNLRPEAEQILLNMVEGLDTPEVRAQIAAKSAALLELIAAGLQPTEGKFNNIGVGIVDGITTGAQGFANGPTVAAVGTTIAATIAASITGSKSISNAIGSQVAGAFTSKPTTTPTPSAGVTVDDSGLKDAQDLTRKILATLAAGAIRAQQAGVRMGQGFTSGLSSGSAAAPRTAAAAAVGAALAANRFRGSMYAAGQSIGQGLASGIASMARQVASAAAAIAFIAVYAARKVLRSASPSQVFRSIGRDIGQGFIQGIKDSEGSMIDAISSAIEKAVTKGAETASRAIAQAQVGQAIFDNLAPGILPGGATFLNVAASRTSLQQGISGLTGDLRSGASGALGDNSNQALFEAQNAIRGLLLDLRLGLEGVSNDVAAARQAAGELSAFDADRARLDRGRRSGALGRTEFNEQLAELKNQLDTGSLSQIEFNKKLKVLNAELTNGTLNADRYAKELKDLGERPAALTLTQLDLLSNSARTLNTGTIAGRANSETVGAALGTIRDFGAAALEAGRPLAEVVAQMAQYTANLRAQALAQGLTGASLDKLIAAYGLSGPALAQFVANLTSLDATTAAGAENVAKITDQLQAIRDYGSELLAAGYNQATVITQLREFRDQLVRQATAFGFSRAAIDALVNAAGLGNTALNDFIRQLNDFNREARDAAAVAEEAARAAREKKAAEEAAAAAAGSPGLQTGAGINRALVENLNIYPVTGNPEAIGLGVVNRLSYGLLV